MVGTVRGGRTATKLPYDAIVDSAHLPDERFDVIIDPVGGEVRTRSLDLLARFGRLLLVGNSRGDWPHVLASNPVWSGNLVVAGFNAGVHLPTHPETMRPGASAALRAVTAGLADVDIEVLPPAAGATAHERLENHTSNGHLVLATS